MLRAMTLMRPRRLPHLCRSGRDPQPGSESGCHAVLVHLLTPRRRNIVISYGYATSIACLAHVAVMWRRRLRRSDHSDKQLHRLWSSLLRAHPCCPVSGPCVLLLSWCELQIWLQPSAWDQRIC